MKAKQLPQSLTKKSFRAGKFYGLGLFLVCSFAPPIIWSLITGHNAAGREFGMAAVTHVIPFVLVLYPIVASYVLYRKKFERPWTHGLVGGLIIYLLCGIPLMSHTFAFSAWSLNLIVMLVALIWTMVGSGLVFSRITLALHGNKRPLITLLVLLAIAYAAYMAIVNIYVLK